MSTAALAGFLGVSALVILATLGFAETGHAIRSTVNSAYRLVVPPERVRRTRALESANVAREVARAVRKHDYRLVGIGGIGLFFPGLEDKDAEVERFKNRFGYRFIDGTSDYAENAEQARYQRAAYEYAKSYNLLLYPQLLAR